MKPSGRGRWVSWLRWLPLAVLPAVVAAGGIAGRNPPRGHVVEIRGMEFHPATLEINAGDTVTWVNRDIVPHTATASRVWDTGPLAKGAEGQYVATEAGTWPYICTLHPTMKGTLVVK